VGGNLVLEDDPTIPVLLMGFALPWSQGGDWTGQQYNPIETYTADTALTLNKLFTDPGNIQATEIPNVSVTVVPKAKTPTAIKSVKPRPCIRIAISIWSDSNNFASSVFWLCACTIGGNSINKTNVGDGGGVWTDIMDAVELVAKACHNNQVYFILDFHIETGATSQSPQTQPFDWTQNFNGGTGTSGASTTLLALFEKSGTGTPGLFKEIFKTLKNIQIDGKSLFDSPFCIIELFNEPSGNNTNQNIYDGSSFNPGMSGLYDYIRNTLSFSGLILIGSQQASSDPLGMANVAQLPNNFDSNGEANIAYTCHIYAADHPFPSTFNVKSKDDLETLITGSSAGLNPTQNQPTWAAPVFISEWSTTQDSGNGTINLTMSKAWFNWWKSYGVASTMWQCVGPTSAGPNQMWVGGGQTSSHLTIPLLNNVSQWPSTQVDLNNQATVDSYGPHGLTFTGLGLYALIYANPTVESIDKFVPYWYVTAANGVQYFNNQTQRPKYGFGGTVPWTTTPPGKTGPQVAFNSPNTPLPNAGNVPGLLFQTFAASFFIGYVGEIGETFICPNLTITFNSAQNLGLA
jgi:hypothetical protein